MINQKGVKKIYKQHTTNIYIYIIKMYLCNTHKNTNVEMDELHVSNLSEKNNN